MNPQTWGFIGALIGTVIRASASIFTTKINAKNVSRNQNKLEIYKRQEIFRRFLRDNYFMMQENIYKSFRLVSMLHVQDMQNLKITGKWQEGSLDSQNDIELMYTFRDLVMQLERIQNEKVREESRNC